MPVPVPYDPVFDAIVAHITSNWDASLAPVVYENDTDGAPTGDVEAWIQVIIDTNLYAQESIGGGEGGTANRWDEDGTVWLHVFTARTIGAREARRIAKGAANLFRGTLLLDDALEFGDANLGAGDPGRENGNYYLISVSVDYRLTDAQ